MPAPLSPRQIAMYIRSGPKGTGPAATAEQVVNFAQEHPAAYDSTMRHLYYKMAEAAFKSSPKGLLGAHQSFVSPWIHQIDRDSSRFMLAALYTYRIAWRAGMGSLSLDSSHDEATAVARQLDSAEHDPGSREELLTLVLRGQAESLWSRDTAGETFAAVRQHQHQSEISRNAWDRGALSYYNAAQVQAQARDPREAVGTIPTMSTAKQALVISMDPGFFRIYGPMVLHNAQQVPETDLVIVLCAEPDEAQTVADDANAYLEGLTRLNQQAAPTNVHIHTTPVPEWVVDRTTFYACARFLALPQILEQYSSIYAIDADLIMRLDPAPFLKSITNLRLSVPQNAGSISTVPWRRYMAGNLAANNRLLQTSTLDDLLAYITVGLQQSQAWTLDQNALSYAIERADPGTFRRLDDYRRPMQVSNFFKRWETNFSRR